MMGGNATQKDILQRGEAADEMMLLKDHSRPATMFPQRAATLENRATVVGDDVALTWRNQPVHASE
jgi:hypothetical protein